MPETDKHEPDPIEAAEELVEQIVSNDIPNASPMTQIHFLEEVSTLCASHAERLREEHGL